MPRPRRSVLAIGLVLGLAIVVAAARVATAGPPRGHGAVVSPHVHHGHPFPRVSPPRPFFGFHSRPFTPFFVSPSFVSAPIVYAPPEPEYGPPPVVYAPPPVVYAPPPMPRVIQYPHGRYELRGDGTTSPYVWVWVPNPPPPPPMPDAAPPPSSQAPEVPAPRSAPTATHEAYRWVDDEGTIHWTDRVENIPPRDRPRARKTNGGPIS